LNVVDTHVWVWWWLDRKKISKAARREMERSDSLLICAISVWEVALVCAGQGEV
jgi:PIN domain nuclease of toxin-antitoxin system